MTRPVIGFIGLGLMGTGFTRRLAGQGYSVIGLDRDARRLEAARGWGVQPAKTPADLAQRADLVLTSVTTTADLVAIIEGENGILAAGRLDGKVLIDHSTTDIEETKRLGGRLQRETGLQLVDAPVSGGPAAAEGGSLAIMAGGSEPAVSQVAPVMAALGRFTHMGPLGAGQATKLVNQSLVLTNYCVIAEAVRIAEAHGIDAAKVPEALGQGHAGSNLLPVLFERMLARDFAPRGYARQVLKDLEMLNDAAHAKGLALPMAGQALTLYRLLVAGGKAELDGSSVLTLWPDPPEGR